jgi:hypothetical protein
MKQHFFLSAIGQAMFYTQSNHERTDKWFIRIITALAVVVVIAQALKLVK